MSRFRRHFFVCVQERPEGGKPACGNRGGRELAGALAQGMMQNEKCWADTSVTPSLCLGPCFEGPNVVVYPEGTWYAHVTESDADELVREHMCEGRVVERLRYEWPGT